VVNKGHKHKRRMGKGVNAVYCKIKAREKGEVQGWRTGKTTALRGTLPPSQHRHTIKEQQLTSCNALTTQKKG